MLPARGLLQFAMKISWRCGNQACHSEEEARSDCWQLLPPYWGLQRLLLVALVAMHGSKSLVKTVVCPMYLSLGVRCLEQQAPAGQ